MVDVSGSDSKEQKTAQPKAAPKAKAAKPATKAAKAPKPAKAKAEGKPKPAPKPALKPASKAAAPKADKAVTAVIVPLPAPAPAPIPAPVADAPEAAPRIVSTAMPVVAGPEWKKRDLVDKVVKRSGVKKKDAKQVVEAMLALMGEALAEGREMILQPMGRIKTTRVKDSGSGRVLICKIRQGGGESKDDKDPLAEDDD